MKRQLNVTLCQTWDKKPLATVDGLAGMMDLRPDDLRILARKFMIIADEADKQPMRRGYMRKWRVYTW